MSETSGGLAVIKRRCCIFCLLILAVPGCGSSGSSVSGTVTLDGKELDQAFITFFPEKGVANTKGGDISNGQYHVSGLSPGKKRVLITAKPTPDIQQGKITFPDRQSLIPADTAGNNQIVEILPGSQTLHFQLGKTKE
jgi:hypothetical protein